jgi:starch-binding outer membrane protein, SusD/RagB family
MRSIYIPIIFLLGIMSCKKSFLEIEPKGKLIAKNVSDYDLLLNSSDFLSTGAANAQVFMGDEVAVVEPYFTGTEPRTQRLFNWSPVVYERQENAPETQALLRQVYICNKIINEVEAADGTESQKRSIRAEARAGRAWVYFMLINYFGKPYNTATSSTDPGFPIITKADVTATTFTREPVAAVYDFIVDDLVSAIPDLPAQTTHRLRMAKAAGEALLGKVYMFMGKFNEALPLLNNALDHIQNAAVPIQLTDYNTAFAPGGLFMPISFFGPTTPVITDDAQTLYARQFSNFWITSSELVISPATVALYKSTDLRLNFYSNTPFPAGPAYPAGLLRRMGPLTTSYGVVLPDLILLRAECKARLNDLAGAVADVESLRRKRMPTADAPVPTAVATNQKLLVEFILQERIREFSSQGFRWFDMRRLSVDPVFGATGFSHSIYAADGSQKKITMPAERIVLKIPAKILNENPGMEDNP